MSRSSLAAKSTGSDAAWATAKENVPLPVTARDTSKTAQPPAGRESAAESASPRDGLSRQTVFSRHRAASTVWTVVAVSAPVAVCDHSRRRAVTGQAPDGTPVMANLTRA
nr:hypothetical protein GCM10020093_082900 [Planobispora longispora]